MAQVIASSNPPPTQPAWTGASVGISSRPSWSMALRTPRSWAAGPQLQAGPLADIAAQTEVAPAANEKVRAPLSATWPTASHNSRRISKLISVAGDF